MSKISEQPPATPPVELVNTWKPVEAAHDAGNRAWLPCTEEFHDEMLNILPPEYLGHTFHVIEAWKHNAKDEGVYLFFIRRPVTACRMATRNEIKKELSL